MSELNSEPRRAVPHDEWSSRSAEALLVEVAKGDQAAFTELYDRTASQVYGLVRSVLRDLAQSEEVTQEVLLEVWRTAPRFDASRGAAGSWVLTMAHRRAVDRVRSERAARNRDQRVGAHHRETGFDVVTEEVETNFEYQQVRKALGQLTAVQREAVELAYYGGHTYREVARLLDVPLGTVKTRLRAALLRLRPTLDSCG